MSGGADGVVVLIPAYNPDEKLLDLVERLKGAFGDILVVNDGSSVGRDVFRRVAEKGVPVVVHEVNRGKGAALKTGFRWIAEHLPKCAAVVTADADGQHRPDDIVRVAEAALVNPESLVLGVRAFTGKVPLRSRFGNWWTRQFFFLFTHMRVADTQTGLRGIPVSLIPRMLEIPGDRYEYEMAMLADARHHAAPPVQIPIETVYSQGNASSHFSPLLDSFRIYGALLHFCASSVGCFLLDNAIFTAVLFAAMRLTDWKRATNTLIAICVARAVSASVNYFYNRRFVFRSAAAKRMSMPRYWLLVLAVMSAGYGCTAGLARILDVNGIAITVLKVVVETALFFLSYQAQRKWVFPVAQAGS
ncbi:MAG: bifunctional glycosyltransferase family 2/GtrA family protein [Kiritimatiellae bacterium]|nr:bifunctional glycosyltransferase family 2/GtrA family protein [Kiritimatiellia bacterium]